MMNKKRVLWIKWILCIILGFAIFSYWIYGREERIVNIDERPMPSKNAVLQSSVAQKTPSTEENSSKSAMGPSTTDENRLNSEGEISTAKGASTSTENMLKQENSTKSPGVLNEKSSSQENVPSNQPREANDEKPNNQVNAVMTANPIPTDAQIIASINLQNQKNLQLEHALTDRINQINQVHEAILAEQAQNPTDTQVKPFVAPLLTAPSGLKEKVRSHEVTVH